MAAQLRLAGTPEAGGLPAGDLPGRNHRGLLRRAAHRALRPRHPEPDSDQPRPELAAPAGYRHPWPGRPEPPAVWRSGILHRRRRSHGGRRDPGRADRAGQRISARPHRYRHQPGDRRPDGCAGHHHPAHGAVGIRQQPDARHDRARRPERPEPGPRGQVGDHRSQQRVVRRRRPRGGAQATPGDAAAHLATRSRARGGDRIYPLRRRPAGPDWPSVSRGSGYGHPTRAGDRWCRRQEPSCMRTPG